MAYILDIAVILIFALAVFIGHKRGFIKTFSGVLAFAAALVVVMLLKAPVANLVYEKAVEPPLVEAIGNTTDNFQQSAVDYYNELPQIIKNLLVQTGVTDGESFFSAMPADGPAPVLRPVLLPLVEMVTALVLFLLAYIAAGILLRMLDLVAKLPLLKQINKSLGFVAGVLSGALWVLLAVSILQLIASFGSADSLINMTTVDNTLLIKWLVSFNPLAYMPRVDSFILPEDAA